MTRSLSYKKRAAADFHCSVSAVGGWSRIPAQWDVYDCDGSHVAIIKGTSQGFREYEAYDPNTLHTISRFSTLRELKLGLEELHTWDGWCGVRGCGAAFTRDGSPRCSCKWWYIAL